MTGNPDTSLTIDTITTYCPTFSGRRRRTRMPRRRACAASIVEGISHLIHGWCRHRHCCRLCEYSWRAHGR